MLIESQKNLHLISLPYKLKVAKPAYFYIKIITISWSTSLKNSLTSQKSEWPNWKRCSKVLSWQASKQNQVNSISNPLWQKDSCRNVKNSLKDVGCWWPLSRVCSRDESVCSNYSEPYEGYHKVIYFYERNHDIWKLQKALHK